jgi:hypothetical protein
VRATNDNTAWSNALHFTYSVDVIEGASVESTLLSRQLTLLQQFVHACCGNSPPSEQMVHDLMAPALPETQRFLGAVLALILAGSGGSNHKGGSLDLERQDAHGCTLMHYVCGLRNTPALQLLLNSSVDPNIADAQGQTPADWAKRYGFHEGETLIARATGQPVPPPPGVDATAASACVVPPLAAAIAAPVNPTAIASANDGDAPPPARSLEQFLEPPPHAEAADLLLTAASAHVTGDPSAAAVP